jgi:hypothetical protein
MREVFAPDLIRRATAEGFGVFVFFASCGAIMAEAPLT